MTPSTAPLRLVSSDPETEPEPTRLPRLATAADVAAELFPDRAAGPAKQAVYTAVREHGMSHVRLGRALRFDRAAVARTRQNRAKRGRIGHSHEWT